MLVLVACICISTTAKEVPVDAGPLSTVSDALDSCSDGDAIILQAGTYTNCTMPLIINKNVTIRGVGAVIDCAHDGGGAAIATAAGCDGARIENVQIMNAEVAVRHDAPASVLRLDGCIVQSCNDSAVIVSGNATLHLYNVTI